MTPRVAQGLELQTEVLVRRTDACIADQVSHLLPSSCSQVLSSCRARQVLLRGCLMRGQTASRKCPSAPRRTGAGEGVIKGSFDARRPRCLLTFCLQQTVTDSTIFL